MPFVTFTVRQGISKADKFHLSAAMIEAQVAAGYERDDLFHRFLETGSDNLLADGRYPDYTADRTDRFIVVEVAISKGKPKGTAAVLAEEAIRQFGERLHLAPRDVLFIFQEIDPDLPRFPVETINSEATADA